jgi:hypothetical protein
MSITADGIMTSEGQMLPFARDFREALAIYARRTWPLHTSVHAAKAWGIDKTTAKNLLKGHASDATITRVLRAGGWSMALPVLGAVIGQTAEQYLEDERRKHVELARRNGALVTDLRAGLGLRDRSPVQSGADANSERRSYTRRVGED